MLNGISKLQKVYNKEFTGDQVEVWGEYFRYWEVKEFNDALDMCIKTCRFLPTIADMYEFSKSD